MEVFMDAPHAGNIKRIRQACANCRRRKTKCSGERPICFHCHQNKHTCVYEPYSATISDGNPHTGASLASITNNEELLHRISTIESRLAELSRQPLHQPVTSPIAASPEKQGFSFEGTMTGSPSFPSPRTCLSTSPSFLPPLPVLRSTVDTYFTHVHNRPYSYFQESSFRQKLDSNLLPRCLILAVLASAVRFSTHEYYAGTTHEASESYTRESWLSVLTDHLTVEDKMSVYVVQTVNLLAVVDYTAGRVSSGWLKIGLAARISQDLHLMREPDGWLSYAEQEEQRRAFWSAYLVDKLISCGRSRPLVIRDEDCDVQLPCDEETFRKGEWKGTYTLQQLQNWNTETVESPSPFALVILMSSMFGQCTRYIHQNRNVEDIPPWHTKSEFSAINSSLLLFESYSKVEHQSIFQFDKQQPGHLLFAHTLFHLCHCLLNHPFLVCLRLKPFGSKVSPSFHAQILQIGKSHAKHLIDLLQRASESGCLVESSFYAYCIAVAGSIHSLTSHFEQQTAPHTQTESWHYFQQSIGFLVRLAKIWVHASKMVVRLREFHAQSRPLASLLDPSCLMDELDPVAEDTLWSMIDYGVLVADPRTKPVAPGLDLLNTPSPSSWDFGSGMLTAMPPGLDAVETDIFGGMTPTMRVNGVEHLLDCS